MSVPVYQMQPITNQMDAKNKKFGKNDMEVSLKKAYDQTNNEETIYVIPTLNKQNKLPSFPMLGVKLPEYINTPGMEHSGYRPFFPPRLDPSPAPAIPMRNSPTPQQPPTTSPATGLDTLDVLVGLHNNTQTLKEAQDLLHQILDILSQRVISEPFKAFDEQSGNLTSLGTESSQNETADVMTELEATNSSEITSKSEGEKTIALHSRSTANTKSESAPMEEPESEEDDDSEDETTVRTEFSTKSAKCPGILIFMYILLISFVCAMN
uniref:Spliced glycoprotein U85.5 n=1 Tax=Bursaphelenchus xylophilus TaxID=6326 RepID=A0A1I7STU8_BURXY